jgi:excisionase family DNA binding protein
MTQNQNSRTTMAERRAIQDRRAPLLLSVPEAAAILRVSRNLLYAEVASGRIPSVRIGRTVRVPRHVVERMVAEGYAVRSS